MYTFRFSKAALKTFHSAQVAMLFMQVVELNTHEDSLYNSAAVDPISCHGSTPHTSYFNMSSHKEDETDVCFVDGEETDFSSDAEEKNMESTVMVANEDTTEKAIGEVNEVALNAEAKRKVGDVRLVWKMVTGKDHPQRKLVLI